MALTKASYSMINGAPINVLDYGADPTGLADSTTAMQAAHNTGKTVYYPTGTYKFTTLTNIISGGIVGDGPQQSILSSTNTTSDNLITYVGPLGLYSNITLFKDFTLQGLGPTTKATGAGIAFNPATGEASYMDFRNVHFLKCPIGIDFVRASLWKIIGCDFLSYSVAGVQTANENVPDSGDSVITACLFNNPYATGSGVLQKSSGGLKIIGNKFLGGSRGYTMNLYGSTSVLIFSGNSVENMVDQCMAFDQYPPNGALFKNIVITGNEFSVGNVAIATGSATFIEEMVIAGNQINMGATGSNACISLVGVTDLIIGDNMIKGNGGLGSSAISLTTCTTGKIGVNTYANLPNPISVTTSSGIFITKDSQSGSSTTLTTGWTGYGGLYISASTAVTFTTPYLVTPVITDVIVTPGSANGVISGIVTSVSKTGFTYQAVSSISAIAATVYWVVNGTL
jgi:hypothetical protein